MEVEMEDRLVKHVSLKTAKAKLMRKRIADSPSKLYTCTVNDGVLTARWNKLGPAGQACASAQCDAYGCEETERQAERKDNRSIRGEEAGCSSDLQTFEKR